MQMSYGEIPCGKTGRLLDQHRIATFFSVIFIPGICVFQYILADEILSMIFTLTMQQRHFFVFFT